MMGPNLNLVILCGILLCGSIGEIAGYNYEIGYEYQYDYKADSHVLGDFRVQTFVKFRVRPLEKRNSSLICQLYVDSFTQSAKGKTRTNPVEWSFNNGFEFSISKDGLIKEIAHHHEEKNDVISLKKVLTSVLSAKGNFKFGQRNNLKFDNWEHDHSGYLQHQYNIQSTTSGYRVYKLHESTDQVYRKHAKTLHYSHSGVIEFVKADDNVILQNKNKHKPPEARHFVPGEKEIEEESGDVKDIKSNTSTEVRLVRKIKLSKVDSTSPLDKYLKVKDSIVVRKEATEKAGLTDVAEDIESNVTCIQSNKDDVNRDRMDCFSRLVQTMGRLQEADYERLATRELSKECQLNDTSCTSRRNVFIDLLLKDGQNFTEEMIIRHFFKNKDVNETDLFRIFFHVPNMKKPSLVYPIIT